MKTFVNISRSGIKGNEHLKTISLLLFLLFFLIKQPASGQEMDFSSFTSGAWVVAIAEQDDYIWAANWRGGISRMHKPTGEMTNYNITNSNLPTNQVNCIAVDHEGIVWAGTRNSLVRFDGEDWFVYNRSNSPLDYVNINSLLVDNNNNLWIGLSTSSLYRFDRNNSWTIYNQNNSGLPSGWVKSLALDLDGSIWIGMELGGGLVHFDGTVWTRYTSSNSGLPENSVHHVSVGPGGDKWISSSNYGPGSLSRFNGVQWTTFNTSNSPLASWVVYTLAITNEGHLWIGGTGGLQYYDGNSWQTHNMNNAPFPGNIVQSLLLSSNSDLWVGFENAVYREDPIGVDTIASLLQKNAAGWTLYNTGNSQLANSVIEQIRFDKMGGAWIATSGGGVSYFDGRSWDWFHLGNSPLPGSYISNIMIDKSERVWISVDGYGLTVKDGNSWTTYNPANSDFSSYWPEALAEAPDGSIWIGTFYDGSLVRFDGEAWKTFHSNETGLPNRAVDEILFDKQQNLWVNHLSMPGIYQLKDDSWRVFNISNSAIPSNFIIKTDIDNAGNIWVATIDGLGRYDGINWEVFNEVNSPLPSNKIKSLSVVNGTELWILTSKGFVFFDGIDKWTVFPDYFGNQPEWENDPICMSVSPSGEIWVGSILNGILLCNATFQSPSLALSVQEMVFDSTLVNTCTIRDYHLSGMNLSDTVRIAVADNFQLSVHPDSTFGNLLSLIPENGSMENTIYVRFCPEDVKIYSDTIIHESEEIGQIFLPVSGIGYLAPELWLSEEQLIFDSIALGNCAVMDYQLVGSWLKTDLVITTEEGFQLGLHPDDASESILVLTPEHGSTENTIYVRFCPETDKTYSGNITHNSEGLPETLLKVEGVGYIMTGLKSAKRATDFSIYPNPADRELFIQINDLGISGGLKIEWLHIDGRVLDRWQYNSFTHGEELILDVSNHSAGTYILRVQTDKQIYFEKVYLLK